MNINTSSGLWDDTTSGSNGLGIWSAGTPAGGPDGAIACAISAGTAVATDPAENYGALARTAPTTLYGALTISQSSAGGIGTDLGHVAIIAGGSLSGGTDNTNPGVLLAINGSLDLAGTIAVWPGTDGFGSIQVNNRTTIYGGAQFVNYNAMTFVVNASWTSSGTPCTWTLRQFADLPPGQFTQTFVQAWTDVAINANLGGIGVLATDYAGNLSDPLAPPYALVYRNGVLWNGAIQVTRKGAGQFSLDLSFSDGIWQLGDHGEIHIFWCQAGSDGETPQWFSAVYYWLVNRLNYETWQRVMLALPNAAPGGSGGLPTLDGDSRAPETPNTAAKLTTPVSIITENTVIQSN